MFRLMSLFSLKHLKKGCLFSPLKKYFDNDYLICLNQTYLTPKHNA